MKISKHEYVLCREDKKDYLVRALEDSTGDFSAYLEHNCWLPNQRTTLTVPAKQIVLNLGPNPSPGKIYGLDVTNLYRGRKEHDDFGTINWFYKPQDKEVGKELDKAMTKVAKKLAKHKLEFLLEEIVWEVLRFHKEKYAGMYIRSKAEKVNPRIQIRPEIMPASEYPYVLYHELGHHLHREFVTSKKLNALWLKVFSTSIKVKTIKKETSLELLTKLLDQEDLPSDFKGQLDEEDALSFKWIIRTIGSHNQLSIKELDTLWEADMKDEIKKVWPSRTISHKELAPVLTEYATKSYYELFAESFAYYMCGKDMPEALNRLIEKSISYAKANK